MEQESRTSQIPSPQEFLELVQEMARRESRKADSTLPEVPALPQDYQEIPVNKIFSEN